MVKTQKQYYLRNMRCAYFPINRRLHRDREKDSNRETERQRQRKRERQKERDRETERERCEMVNTQKWYIFVI